MLVSPEVSISCFDLFHISEELLAKEVIISLVAVSSLGSRLS